MYLLKEYVKNIKNGLLWTKKLGLLLETVETIFKTETLPLLKELVTMSKLLMEITITV